MATWLHGEHINRANKNIDKFDYEAFAQEIMGEVEKDHKALSTKARQQEARMELAQGMVCFGLMEQASSMLDKDFKDYEYLEVCMKVKREKEAKPIQDKEKP